MSANIHSDIVKNGRKVSQTGVSFVKGYFHLNEEKATVDCRLNYMKCMEKDSFLTKNVCTITSGRKYICAPTISDVRLILFR